MLGFADDIDYTQLKAEAKKIGLAMNTPKTKYMRGRGSKEVDSPCLRPLAVNGNELEKVDEFVCLGSLMTADNDTSKEIRMRILAGNRTYFGLRKTLTY